MDRRTQDAIAIGNGGDWLLVNASPDVSRQLEQFEPLWPRRARDTPIGAIALTNGDLDHVLGLLSLRESQPLRVLATESVREGLVNHNAMMRTLARSPDQVKWLDLPLRSEVVLADLGIAITALPIPGKAPIHLERLIEPSQHDNVGLRVRELRSDRTVAIATSVGALDAFDEIVHGASAILFDGTFWSDDELIAQGLGVARARQMAHVPVGGRGGSLERLIASRPRRFIYTHINNTNPMLRRDSPERMEVERAGGEIAFDGMEISI